MNQFVGQYGIVFFIIYIDADNTSFFLLLFGGKLEEVKAIIQLILRIIPLLSLPLFTPFLFLFTSLSPLLSLSFSLPFPHFLSPSPPPYTQDALAALETPGGPSQHKRKRSTPLSEVIVKNLKLALANSSRNAVALSASPQLKDAHSEKVELYLLLKGSFRLKKTFEIIMIETVLFLLFFHGQEDAPKPLENVVVCVSKKLSKKQSELNGIAASLGADYR